MKPTRSTGRGRPWKCFGTGSYVPKTSFLSEDGADPALPLPGKAERLRQRRRARALPLPGRRRRDRCVSCRPSGEAPSGGPALGSVTVPRQIRSARTRAALPRATSPPTAAASSSRPPKRSVPADTNGEGGCPARAPRSSNTPPAPTSMSGRPRSPDHARIRPRLQPPERWLHLPDLDRQEHLPLTLRRRLRSGDDVFFFTRQQPGRPRRRRTARRL